MKAEPHFICPICGKPALKRLLSAGSGMIFRGTGFYLTDYKNNNSNKKSKTSSSESPAPPSSSTTPDKKS